VFTEEIGDDAENNTAVASAGSNYNIAVVFTLLVAYCSRLGYHRGTDTVSYTSGRMNALHSRSAPLPRQTTNHCGFCTTTAHQHYYILRIVIIIIIVV